MPDIKQAVAVMAAAYDTSEYARGVLTGLESAFRELVRMGVLPPAKEAENV